MTMTSVAVVLLSKDEPNIAESLVLLQPQCEALGAKCIVIDASEKRLDDIRIANPWVEWIDYEKPFWRASSIPHQRNVGVRIANTNIVAFCDAGGLPTPNWLESCVEALTSGGYQYICGPIEPKGVSPFGSFNDSPTGTIPDSAPTANVAFTRATFDRINGFDERFNYGSDIDFQQRSTAAGTPCIVVNDARMVMPWGESAISTRRSWRWGRGAGRNFRFRSGARIAYLRRHPMLLGWCVLTGYSLATLIASLVFATFWPLLPWAAMALLWILKNRSTARLDLVARDHSVQAIAFMYELMTSLLPRGARVGIVGYESESAQTLLTELDQVGNPATHIKHPNWLVLVFMRLRGLRLVVVQPSSSLTGQRTGRTIRRAKRLGLLAIIDDDRLSAPLPPYLEQTCDGMLQFELSEDTNVIGTDAEGETKGVLLNRLALRALRGASQ
ncbi:MAG: glycosyltransferase [Actinobacteria bacterium]|nr:glycosyltransferase [Actinomycetota bacterium]